MRELGKAVKRILLAVGLLLLSSPVAAEDSKLTVRESPFLAGEYDVFDNDYRRVGRIRESPFLAGEYQIEGLDGRRKGRIRKDRFDDGDWSVEADE